jgi:hypothetical protein
MSLADEWFADFLARCSRKPQRLRVMVEGLPRRADQTLQAERRYDQETERLLRKIHDGRRRPIPGVHRPLMKGTAA